LKQAININKPTKTVESETDGEFQAQPSEETAIKQLIEEYNQPKAKLKRGARTRSSRLIKAFIVVLLVGMPIAVLTFLVML
jgi:hypothetical protein